MKNVILKTILGALIISAQATTVNAGMLGTLTELTIVDGQIRNGSEINTSASAVSINLNFQNDDRGVFEFSLDSIPDYSRITSADLELFVIQGGGQSGAIGAYRIFGYTGDGQITASDFHQTKNLLLEFEHEVGVFDIKNFDVSSFIQAQVNSRSLSIGFLVTAISQDLLIGFESLESSTFNRPALLRIDFVVPLFANGFESGDTDLWTSVVGE